MDRGIARLRQAVVIVERNLLFRAGLAHALNSKSLEVFAECSSIEEVPIGDCTSADAILLLIGLDTAKIGATVVALLDLRLQYNNLNIMIFYDRDRIDPLAPETSEIVRLADAVLPKDKIDGDSVIKAVDLVLLGAKLVSNELRQNASANGHTARQRALVTGLPDVVTDDHTDTLNQRERLTERETAVLSFLMRGLSNKAIAREVGISESTVKIHIKNLMLKINAKNRTQAATWAYSNIA